MWVLYAQYQADVWKYIDPQYKEKAFETFSNMFARKASYWKTKREEKLLCDTDKRN